MAKISDEQLQQALKSCVFQSVEKDITSAQAQSDIRVPSILEREAQWERICTLYDEKTIKKGKVARFFNIRRVAVAVLLVLVVMSSVWYRAMPSYAGDPQVVIENHEYYFDIYADPNDDALSEFVETERLPTMIPEEFDVKRIQSETSGITYRYTTSLGQRIYFSQLPKGEKITIGARLGEVSSVQIGDREVTVVTWDGESILLCWVDVNLFAMVATGVDMQSLIQMIRSIS